MVKDPETFPFIIVANKLDLADKQRAVSFGELKAYAEDNGELMYMECSAKENMNVEQAFL